MKFMEEINRVNDGQDSPQFVELIGQKLAIDVIFKDSALWQLIIKFFAFESILAISLN